MLSNESLDKNIMSQSIQLIRKAIDKGIFDELIPIYYWKQGVNDKNFITWSYGIPLAQHFVCYNR